MAAGAATNNARYCVVLGDNFCTLLCHVMLASVTPVCGGRRDVGVGFMTTVQPYRSLHFFAFGCNVWVPFCVVPQSFVLLVERFCACFSWCCLLPLCCFSLLCFAAADQEGIETDVHDPRFKATFEDVFTGSSLQVKRLRQR